MTQREISRSKRRGPKIKPRIQFPPAKWDDWIDPPRFHDALDLHMRRHGDLICTLHDGICLLDENLDRTTIAAWRRGSKEPESVLSFKILNRIECRYRLPFGYFRGKLLHRYRSIRGHETAGTSRSERARLAWHLPDDFDARSAVEQQEILSWVRKTILSGATSYRRFQSEAAKEHYAIRFPHSLLIHPIGEARMKRERVATNRRRSLEGTLAPPALIDELRQLLEFKTAALTPLSYSRNGTWGKYTAAQNVEHFGLLFGALAAKPNSLVRGYGVSRENLCFAHLAFPTVWDWYVQWRQQRRGFYTRWEVNMLQTAAALTREATGWLRQTPEVCNRMTPIPGLISPEEVNRAKASWDITCLNMYRHALVRIKEIGRLTRVHRDPFEPILVVLEADSPLAQYRRIVDEIVPPNAG